MIKGGGFHAIGRRKTAVARVYLRPGTVKFLVNAVQIVGFDQHFARRLRAVVCQHVLQQIAVIWGIWVSCKVVDPNRLGHDADFLLGQAQVAKIGRAHV